MRGEQEEMKGGQKDIQNTKTGRKGDTRGRSRNGGKKTTEIPWLKMSKWNLSNTSLYDDKNLADFQWA